MWEQFHNIVYTADIRLHRPPHSNLWGNTNGSMGNMQ